MKKLFICLPVMVLIVFFVLCNSIMAQEMKENLSLNRHVGPYAEANMGYTIAWFAGEFLGNDFKGSTSAGFGWTVAGGYMFSHWFGAEAGYLQFSPTVEVDEDSHDIDIGGFYLAGRFNIPVKDKLSVILKLGGMTLSVSDDSDTRYVSEIAPFTGIGLGYALTDKIDFRVQFQGPNLIFVGAGVLSGGVAIRF